MMVLYCFVHPPLPSQHRRVEKTLRERVNLAAMWALRTSIVFCFEAPAQQSTDLHFNDLFALMFCLEIEDDKKSNRQTFHGMLSARKFRESSKVGTSISRRRMSKFHGKSACVKLQNRKNRQKMF